jgi:hypothetical protein
MKFMRQWHPFNQLSHQTAEPCSTYDNYLTGSNNFTVMRMPPCINQSLSIIINNGCKAARPLYGILLMMHLAQLPLADLSVTFLLLVLAAVMLPMLAAVLVLLAVLLPAALVLPLLVLLLGA